MAHPAVSPDGMWLYFTSDMPGGLGGTDIWRVRIGDSGFDWVENLGAPIKVEGDGISRLSGNYGGPAEEMGG